MEDSKAGPGAPAEESSPAGARNHARDTDTATRHPVATTEGSRGPLLSLGASEVAAALGLNHLRRPIQLWLELTGRVAPSPDNPATEWGRLLEPVIREKYAAAHHLRVFTPPPVFRNEWMRASPDAVVVTLGGEWLRGLEVKTAHWRQAHLWGESGGSADDIPLAYEMQCRWSMAVCSLPRWDVAALIGGSDYREYSIDRNEATEALLLEMAEAWWVAHIVKDQEPTPDGSKAFSQWLVRKWPREHPATVMPTPRSDELVDTLRDIKRGERELQQRKALVEQELKQLIGSFTGLVRFRERGEPELLRCSARAGRKMTDWKAVTQEVAERAHFDSKALAEIAAQHTRQAAGSRPLITPRHWLAAGDEDDGDNQS